MSDMTKSMILIFSEARVTLASVPNIPVLDIATMKLVFAGVLGKEAPAHEKR